MANKESSKAKEHVATSEKKNLGLTADKDDFSEWFSQLMIKADLADYTEVSGCIVFKPNSWAIWEALQFEVNKRLKKAGVKNVYFPLFIPEKFLTKEKEHVEGFSPEVAWVTHAGDTKLSERLAIRPTSEAIIYPSISKWIRSWRDLPLKYNQWSNVVRWEFTHPVPFFRTREFWFNEGHTAFATEAEALAEEKVIIDIYKDLCENYFALYGYFGRKTEQEKFAGAVFSSKLHYVIPNGRMIEGPCFHHDGQNFAKAYDVKFLDKNEKVTYAWQNTWAVSTRMLGVMFATHSDDKGLILPPKIAPNKIVIIPILFDDSREKVLKKAHEIAKEFEEEGSFVDVRDSKPGFKFNEWELKGIPIRIEIGPKDLEKDSCVVVRRDTAKKEVVLLKNLKKEIPALLDSIQSNLFANSKKLFESKIDKASTLQELIKIVNEKRIGLVPMCKNSTCEETLKSETKGAKAVVITSEKLKGTEKCIICNKKADYLIYAGKTY